MSTSGNRVCQVTNRLLAHDPSLTCLTLANHPGVPRVVMDAMAHNSVVRKAHFELTEWDDEQCDELLQSGAPNHALESLFLTRNNITSAGLPALSQVLERGRLTSLNLSANPLGSELAPLGRAIARNCLAVLSLNETQRHGEGIEALVCELARGTHSLTALHLQGNGIGEDVAERIAPALVATVVALYLGKNRVGDAGAAILARACVAGARTRPVLQRLSLLDNAVGDDGARPFAEALGVNPGLQQLNLSHNRIGDAGVVSLSCAVQRNTRLRTLDVGVSSHCSREAAQALHHQMAREQLTSRQHRAFRDVSRLLLLAHGSHAHQRAADPLCKLPHAVLLLILTLAAPPNFELQ